MGKKQVAVSLRKPPPASLDGHGFAAPGPDAFVGAAEPARQAVPATPRATEGPSVATRVGERRELTVYLPLELTRRLSVRCLELDRDVSNVVADALAELRARLPRPLSLV
jgi:hypothetical protein